MLEVSDTIAICTWDHILLLVLGGPKSTPKFLEFALLNRAKRGPGMVSCRPLLKLTNATSEVRKSICRQHLEAWLLLEYRSHCPKRNFSYGISRILCSQCTGEDKHNGRRSRDSGKRLSGIPGRSCSWQNTYPPSYCPSL